MKGESEMDTEHIHVWSTAPQWGVIIGVSKCIVCKKISTKGDFPSLTFDSDGISEIPNEVTERDQLSHAKKGRGNQWK